MPSTPSTSIDRSAASGSDLPPPLRRARSSLRLLTELSRERVALRHLNSWTELYKPEYIDRRAFSPDRPPPIPAACHDTGLAAFAQLAALRIGVRRAFVTLLSRETEYVLVESTRSMSLQSDFTEDERDKSWLGTSCFERADGINDVALDGWRKARHYRQRPESIDHYYTEGMSGHWCILSDVGQNAKYNEKPLVSRAECARFYFSVPVRDFDGTVIGSLTMLDDKPRYGVSAAEMLFCEDLSDTIAQHLFGSTVTSQRQRSERLIQALGTFNNGGSSLRDWWTGQDNVGTSRGGREKKANESGTQQQARFDTEFGVGEDRTVEGSRATSQDTKTNVKPSPRSSKPHTKEARDKFDASEQIKRVYGRASNLLREALGSAGVVFFDATAAASARPLARPKFTNTMADDDRASDRTSSPRSTLTTSASSDDSKTQTNSDTDMSDNNERRSKQCKVVGSSTQIQSSDNAAQHSPLQLTEKDLARLVKSYPSGKIFSYAVNGNVYSGSDESAGSESTGTDTLAARANTKHNRYARMLRKVVGDARSIAFYPIWDDNNQRHRSCLFAWTLHSNRFFDSTEDLTYLSAFGHSLRAEFGRIETISSDLAKGRFISSVSHELRSPLHGVLAGIELLQDSRLTPFQEEMALSVALAGRTLLDTVNHILDYSKISNLTRDQKKERTRVDAARHKSAGTNESNPHDMVDVDIARLTEEVIESVVSAHRYSQSLNVTSTAEANESTRTSTDAQLEDGDVSVTLDIDQRVTWTTPMAPGSWTRVLTNIVGNALKYTLSGVISIRLSTKEGIATKYGNGPGTIVILQVVDTGIGMSKEFISTELFTPFRQADPHSAGTGLGLSIVREVAKEFDASVGVDSEPGKGTVVSVQFATRFTDSPPIEEEGENEAMPTSKPRRLCMLDMNDSPTQNSAVGTKAVTESVQRTASQWLDSEITSSRGLTSKARASLCVIHENDLSYLHSSRADGVKSFITSLAAGGSRLLVLGQSIASAKPAFEFEDFDVPPLYIHQPIGPRKLLRVIANAKDSTIGRQESDYALHNTRPHSSARIIKGDSPGVRSGDPSVTGSYFELPRVSEEQQPRRPSLLVTPILSTETLAQTSEPPAEAPADAPSEPVEDLILLVEDNIINMRLLTALMTKQGMPHECAKNGLEALEAYKRGPLRFYLILMDMSMPVMDGFESTAKIREFERKNKLRPANIAALTGVTNEAARSDAFSAGVNRYLTKPIQISELKQLVVDTRGALPT